MSNQHNIGYDAGPYPWERPEAVPCCGECLDCSNADECECAKSENDNNKIGDAPMNNITLSPDGLRFIHGDWVQISVIGKADFVVFPLGGNSTIAQKIMDFIEDSPDTGLTIHKIVNRVGMEIDDTFYIADQDNTAQSILDTLVACNRSNLVDTLLNINNKQLTKMINKMDGGARGNDA